MHQKEHLSATQGARDPLTTDTATADIDERDFAAVVVGFDGSRSSRAALAIGADEAVARGLSLTVLSVVAAEDNPLLTASAQSTADLARHERITKMAAAAAAEVSAARAGLGVEVVVVQGSQLDRHRRRLDGCRLLVLGDQGRLGVRAFLLGSTSHDLVRAVRSPVLVVPDRTSSDPRAITVDQLREDDRPGPAGSVVVGVGLAPTDLDVLRLAGAEAVLQHTPLVVLHAHPRTGRGGAAAEVARQELDALVNQAGLDPQLAVTSVVSDDGPAQALLRHGRLADRIVIGSRGPIALARLAAGSVSRQVLDHAVRPVLIVPVREPS